MAEETEEEELDPAEHKARLIEALHAELGENTGSSAKWIVVVAVVIVFGALAVMAAIALRNVY